MEYKKASINEPIQILKGVKGILKIFKNLGIGLILF